MRARPTWAALAASLSLIAVTSAPTSAAQPEPVAPPEFVSLTDVDPSILLDIRYVTPHNFTGKPVDGYQTPTCILTRPAAEAVQRAQQQFVAQGYSLKIYDCYRPQRAVDSFVAWANDLSDRQMEAEFYPRVDKTRLFADGYIAEQSGHSRGSTVDLTLVSLPPRAEQAYVPGQPLVDCAAPVSERFPDNSLDMGTGYDCFDTLSHTLDPRVQGDQLKNRLLLKDGLEKQGLQNYENEWWHFTYKPEPFPDTYFDFPVDPASLVSPR
ncbi:M15 family metallopeptidase [Mycolicibacterium parafortuitum]|uniref:D-alanyl-D-alanine dipeptidase n=1 Tax=Mycolicibacterium parafortuitum TaxID=39692 RepID=A0A375YHZ2_MYCPF|nr:M15 family metallopeptidase [Mycolicibacterium parafortuitum]ORB30526.1 D-alanyl-D-alanine dipeptidase [Mycolicibacterium parafortuitum]SRX80752.1 D-alanyl-D-alanine dipeptidase [Streptomyces bingchenggensis BCW-1] [Mycolicibacterium parafortuitum]